MTAPISLSALSTTVPNTSDVLAIDSGPESSAWVLYDPISKCVNEHAIQPNSILITDLAIGTLRAACMVVEEITSFGMPVGAEVFQTCVWIGRFLQAFPGLAVLVPRRDVKLHLCQNPRAKDGNIRQALLDRFGPGKDRAIGSKKAPGPLYGVRRDEWAALALAVTWAETEGHSAEV